MESSNKGTSTHGENVETKSSGLLMHEDVQLSPEEKRAERRLVWKIDLIILPLLSLMYFLAALDRGDVGNAEVAGMGTELALTASQYSQCVAFFFIGYIVFQPPGQLLVRKVQPHIQLGTAMIGWGLCTTLICLAKNWQTVAGLRILVGSFEAFIQAAPLYLSIWYKREELATRGAIFFSMMAIAGTMNGLIAYGIQVNLDNVHGWVAWRWIFLIEGVMSIGSGFFVMALLPPVPERVHRFFTEEEKQIAIRRSKQAFNTPHTGVKLKQLRAVVTDRKVWFYAFFYSMMNISLSGFSSFLPLIVRSFGYSRVTTQILTIPVYIAAAISTVGFAVASDRARNRGHFLAVSFAVASLGWLFLIVSKSKGLSLAGCFLAGMGTYPSVVLIQAWQTSNVIGFTKRAGALAFLMVFGQSFGVMEVEIFTDRPSYYRGKGFALAATAAAALVTPLFQLYLKRQNAEKLAKRDTDEAAARRSLGIEEIGDEHPDFMYWL